MSTNQTTRTTPIRLPNGPVATLYATDALRQQLDEGTGLTALLADHLGWSRQLVSNIKAGRRGVRPADAPAFAAYLGQPVAVLFSEPGVVQEERDQVPEPATVASIPSPTQATPPVAASTAHLPEFLTPQELGDFLHVSPDTIRRRVLDGTIRRVPLGGKGSPIRISRQEVDRLIGVS